MSRPREYLAGWRLRVALEATPYRTLRSLAKRLETTEEAVEAFENRLSGYMRGKPLIPVREMRRIKQLTGITLEWVYDGDDKLLPGYILDHVRAQKIPA